ncbi:NAD-dependent deacylase [Halosquirtibacter xylanolyticus]|uniref:SIR2 family NAD-dependent protein deacylase n=1 Tax=Halosquirtibacter xylanolyticus TaxID=3374599 RepID=UPI00374A1787|nr:NAD-dependent deacylase [Prolixibacteraceae bacterium]
MKRIVVLTGAGMSAESGLKTFRDSDGLWENYDVMEVASIEGWERDPVLVQRFYNDRRRQLWDAQPNQGHSDLVKLEQHYHVDIVTQNVDDLHERAGSHNVLHLHGELRKVRSTRHPELVYELGPQDKDVNMGDLCEKGFQLRPDIVWFGEAVPRMDPAINMLHEADIVLVVGTSLSVYPAASLVHYAQIGVPVYLVDPKRPDNLPAGVKFICATASEGISIFYELISQQ